jgi:hypothetical protein
VVTLRSINDGGTTFKITFIMNRQQTNNSAKRNKSSLRTFVICPAFLFCSMNLNCSFPAFFPFSECLRNFIFISDSEN